MRYWWLLRRAANIREERKGCTLSPKREAKLQKTVTKLATHFPDNTDWVLPTGLGHTIRAFEVYPRVMYGLESIEGWGRLLGVIPTDYREQINSAKTQMDFWVNLWLLALLFLPEYAAFTIYGDAPRNLWLPVVTVLLALFAASRANPRSTLPSKTTTRFFRRMKYGRYKSVCWQGIHRYDDAGIIGR